MPRALLVLLALAAMPVAAQTKAGPRKAPPPPQPAPVATPAPDPGLLRESDLAPVFTSAPAAEGKAAFDARRFEEAAAKLGRSKQPEAAYVRALALLELSRPEEALAALERLEERLPAIRDRILFLRGEALSRLDRPREAIAAFAAVSEGALVSADARLRRARLAAALGERGMALEALGPLLSASAPADVAKPDLAAAALLLAGRVRASGPAPDPAGARVDFLQCWSEHPLSGEAADCLRAARALPAPHDGPPGRHETLRRAERLLDANRNQAALALLEPMLEGLPPADAVAPFACRVRGAVGRAHRKERSYRKAIETLRPVVAGCDDPGLRVRSLYLLASATSIAGDREEGVELYRRLAREFPDHSFADDALFFASDLLARAGRPDEARDALTTLVREHLTGDFRDEARFRLAWMSRRAGDLEGAMAQLLAIEEEKDGRDSYEHARAAYWRARILAGTGEPGRTAALAIWTDLADRYPTDYYGLVAGLRLAEAGSGVAPRPAPAGLGAAGPVTYDPGALRDDPHFRAGILLLRMGLPHAAAEELAVVAPGPLRAGTGAAEAVLLVADLLDRAGDHRAAHHLLRTRARAALRPPPTAQTARAWRIAYPPAYREHVKRWAPAAGVPVDLLQALMREESALDPRVISPAGAVGLTQLMLPTAAQVAGELKLKRPSRSDLMDPSLNIRLGSRYLGSLVRRFDGSLPLALAAYNAGPGAVGRWLQARGDLDLDEFVEEIPIEETRGYVKRVLRSYAAYRLLYGEGEAAAAGDLFRLASGKS